LPRRGTATALLFHGSDIRDLDRHAAAHAELPFAPRLWAGTNGPRPLALANRALIPHSGVPVFISTPDLFDDAPDAT